MGYNLRIQGNSLKELLEKFAQITEVKKGMICLKEEQIGFKCILQLINATICFKQKNGKWASLGDNGIEVAVGNLYDLPKTNWVLYTRWE